MSSQSLDLTQVPVWQPDEEVESCSLCQTPFTLFNRRHHCRKCGKIICGDCSNHEMNYLPSTYVVCPPSQVFLESPHVPHRTCDECALELSMIRQALENVDNIPEIIKTTPIQNKIIPENENDYCPICNLKISSYSNHDRENHINQCLEQAQFSGSPEISRSPNRMLVYKLPENFHNIDSEILQDINDLKDNECCICLEEFSPNDKVGRLECLCMFHYKCITDWFKRKGPGECPVHAVHS